MTVLENTVGKVQVAVFAQEWIISKGAAAHSSYKSKWVCNQTMQQHKLSLRRSSTRNWVGVLHPLSQWVCPLHDKRSSCIYQLGDCELPSHSAPPCGEEWQAGGASSFLFSTTKRRNMSLQKTEESEYYFGSTSWQCWDTLLGEVNCMHPLQLACFLYGIIKGRVTNKVKNSGGCGKFFTLC